MARLIFNLTDQIFPKGFPISDSDLQKYSGYVDTALVFVRDLEKITTTDFVRLLDNDTLTEGLKNSGLSFLSDNVDILNVIQGWRDSYDGFIKSMESSPVHSFNLKLSGYKISNVHQAILISSAIVCTMTFMVQIFVLVKMLKRRPDFAVVKICCTPCSQFCFGLVFLFGCVIMIFVGILPCLLGVLNDPKTVIDQALITFADAKDGSTNIYTKIDSAIKGIEGLLRDYGTGLKV